MTVNALHVTLNAAKLLPGVGDGDLPGLPEGRGGRGGNRPSNNPPPSGGGRVRRYGRKAWDSTKNFGRKSWGLTKNLGRGMGKGLGGLGKGLMKVGGKAAIPLSLAMGAYDIATSENKGKAASGMAGSLAGGLAGAKLGAMGGAAIGSIIPGVGTAVGGALGGLLGGIGGAIFGEELGNSIYEGITNNLEGLKQWFSDTWNSIVETCAPVINTIVGIFGFIHDGIVAVFAPVAQWFDTTVWQPVKSLAQTAMDGVKEIFSAVWEGIKGIWNGVAGWFDENVWSPLKAKASEALNFIGKGITAAQQRGAQSTGLQIGRNATGSNYFGGGWTEINERGGEIVDLPSGSRIYPHATTQKMLAEQFGGTSQGGNNYSISGNTFVVREEADIDRIAHSLFSMISSAESNYGGV